MLGAKIEEASMKTNRTYSAIEDTIAYGLFIKVVHIRTVADDHRHTRHGEGLHSLNKRSDMLLDPQKPSITSSPFGQD